jgi:hypothetical protein
MVPERQAVLAHEEDQILATDPPMAARRPERGQAARIHPVDDRQGRDMAELGCLERREYRFLVH